MESSYPNLIVKFPEIFNFMPTSFLPSIQPATNSPVALSATFLHADKPEASFCIPIAEKAVDELVE